MLTHIRMVNSFLFSLPIPLYFRSLPLLFLCNFLCFVLPHSSDQVITATTQIFPLPPPNLKKKNLFFFFLGLKTQSTPKAFNQGTNHYRETRDK